jgi:3-oxoacyl-[acyl-carrier protein] reductase
MNANTNKIAVLTGAASDGIGMAVTSRLLADGFEVIGSFDREDAANAELLAASGAAVTLVEVDHGDRASLEALVGAVPSGRPVHALVNAQFFFAMEQPAAFDFMTWDRSLAVNLTAPVFLYHRLARMFAEDAAVVTVTSTEGFVGSYGASAYAATKAAIHNATMSLANLGGPHGTRVNAVAAGWIGGVMDTDDVFNMSRAITPLGRLGSPEEIAAVVAFLLSPQSSFVNGTVITCDGGYRSVDTIAKFEFEAAQEQAPAVA